MTATTTEALIDLAYLSKLLDAIDGDTFTSLEGRITVQKKVYLAQVSGVSLGYSFDWHIFGPYSEALSEDCRGLSAQQTEARELAEPLLFTDEAASALQGLRTILKPPEEVGVSTPAWLETLSSVHMLARRLFAKKSISELSAQERDDVVDTLLSRKPYLEHMRCHRERIWEALTS